MSTKIDLNNNEQLAELWYKYDLDINSYKHKGRWDPDNEFQYIELIEYLLTRDLITVEEVENS